MADDFAGLSDPQWAGLKDPDHQVGAAEAAGRTLAGAARRAVGAVEMAAGGVLSAGGLAPNSMSEAVLRGASEQFQKARESDIQPGEKMTTGGKIAEFAAGIPAGVVEAPTLPFTQGADVIERGGSTGQALGAAAMSLPAAAISAAAPELGGRYAGKLVQGGVKKIAAKVAGGAAAGTVAGPASRAVQNLGLPDDMQQDVAPTWQDVATGAGFGLLAKTVEHPAVKAARLKQEALDKVGSTAGAVAKAANLNDETGAAIVGAATAHAAEKGVHPNIATHLDAAVDAIKDSDLQNISDRYKYMRDRGISEPEVKAALKQHLRDAAERVAPEVPTDPAAAAVRGALGGEGEAAEPLKGEFGEDIMPDPTPGERQIKSLREQVDLAKSDTVRKLLSDKADAAEEAHSMLGDANEAGKRGDHQLRAEILQRRAQLLKKYRLDDPYSIKVPYEAQPIPQKGGLPVERRGLAEQEVVDGEVVDDQPTPKPQQALGKPLEALPAPGRPVNSEGDVFHSMSDVDAYTAARRAQFEAMSPQERAQALGYGQEDADTSKPAGSLPAPSGEPRPVSPQGTVYNDRAQLEKQLHAERQWWETATPEERAAKLGYKWDGEKLTPAEPKALPAPVRAVTREGQVVPNKPQGPTPTAWEMGVTPGTAAASRAQQAREQAAHAAAQAGVAPLPDGSKPAPPQRLPVDSSKDVPLVGSLNGARDTALIDKSFPRYLTLNAKGAVIKASTTPPKHKLLRSHRLIDTHDVVAQAHEAPEGQRLDGGEKYDAAHGDKTRGATKYENTYARTRYDLNDQQVAGYQRWVNQWAADHLERANRGELKDIHPDLDPEQGSEPNTNAKFLEQANANRNPTQRPAKPVQGGNRVQPQKAKAAGDTSAEKVGGSDARSVRSDQGQAAQAGDTAGRSKDSGGENLQRGAEARPSTSDRSGEAAGDSGSEEVDHNTKYYFVKTAANSGLLDKFQAGKLERLERDRYKPGSITKTQGEFEKGIAEIYEKLPPEIAKLRDESLAESRAEKGVTNEERTNKEGPSDADGQRPRAGSTAADAESAEAAQQGKAGDSGPGEEVSRADQGKSGTGSGAAEGEQRPQAAASGGAGEAGKGADQGGAGKRQGGLTDAEVEERYRRMPESMRKAAIGSLSMRTPWEKLSKGTKGRLKKWIEKETGTEATHKEPGKPAEPVTPAVVTKALGDSPKSVKAARDDLVEAVTKKAAHAPTEAEAMTKAGASKDKEGWKPSKTAVQPSAPPEVKQAALERNKRTMQDVHKEIGYVEFHVPGDGKFKILNTKEEKADLDAQRAENAKREAEGDSEFEASRRSGSKAPAPATGHKIEEIRKALVARFGESTVAALERAGKLRIVNDYAGLDKREVEWSRATGGVRAFFDKVNKRATLIANRLPAAEAAETLLHEVGIHSGARGLLGEAGFAKMLSDLSALKNGGNKAAIEAWEHVQKNYPHLDENSHRFKEEVAARLAEGHQDLPFVKRLMTAIRTALYRMGFTKGLDEHVVRSIAMSALRREAGMGGLGGLVHSGFEANRREPSPAGLNPSNNDPKQPRGGLVAPPPEARDLTWNMFRERLSKVSRYIETADAKLDPARTMIDKLIGQNYDKVKAAYHEYETTGRSTTLPQLNPVFAEIRRSSDAIHAAIVATGKPLGYIENHLVHAYKDPKKATQWFSDYFRKNPLTKAGFTKERYYATLKDAEAAGLEPLSKNIIDTQMMRWAQMKQYEQMHAHRADLAARGWLQDEKPGAFGTPPGWAKINDPLFQGKLVPEGVARDLNNYLNPGIDREGWWKTYRGIQGGITSANLGLSAFHPLATTFDVVSSRLASSLERVARGQFALAAKEAAHLPGDLFSAFTAAAGRGRGHELQDTWRGLIQGDPVTQAIMQMAERGGARGQMMPTSDGQAWKQVQRAWHQGDLLKAGGQGLKALLENTGPLIHHSIVPAQKWLAKDILIRLEMDKRAASLGVAPGDYVNIAKQMGDDASRQIMARVMDSVDDRLGQYTYANRRINKMVLTALQGGLRSPGWFLGGASTMLRPFYDLGRVVKPEALLAPLDKAGKITDAHMGRVTGHVAYFATMMSTYAAINGGINQIIGDQHPEHGGIKDWRDFFSIRFPDGHRFIPASYAKEFFELQSPLHRIASAASPALHIAGEGVGIVNALAGNDSALNRDYFGNMNVDPDAKPEEQFEQVVKWAGKQVAPFAVTGGMQGAGESSMEKLLPSLGMPAAPKAISNSKFQDFVENRYFAARPAGNKTPQKAEHDKALTDAVKEVKANPDYDLSKFDQKDREKIKQYAKGDVETYRFGQLSLQQQLEAWDKATPDEREQYKLRQAIQHKYLSKAGQNEIRAMDPDDARELREKIKATRG